MWEIFKTVLLLSCAGGGLTLVLLLIKPFTSKRFSAAWQYYVWILVLLAALLPVRFSKKPVEVSLVGERPAPAVTETARVTSEPPPETDTDNTPVTVAELEGKGLDLDIYDIIPIIWLCGAVIFILSALISYWRFLLKKRGCAEITEGMEEFFRVKDKLGVKRKITLKRFGDLDAPMLVGVFRPIIYVPEREIGSAELEMIFTHELTHYKRRDLWYKWFALAVNAVHWFNPLIYAAVKNINEACELSCDECVTRDMDDEGKKLYMSTIIELIRKRERG